MAPQQLHGHRGLQRSQPSTTRSSGNLQDDLVVDRHPQRVSPVGFPELANAGLTGPAPPGVLVCRTCRHEPSTRPSAWRRRDRSVRPTCHRRAGNDQVLGDPPPHGRAGDRTEPRSDGAAEAARIAGRTQVRPATRSRRSTAPAARPDGCRAGGGWPPRTTARTPARPPGPARRRATRDESRLQRQAEPGEVRGVLDLGKLSTRARSR